MHGTSLGSYKMMQDTQPIESTGTTTTGSTKLPIQEANGSMKSSALTDGASQSIDDCASSGGAGSGSSSPEPPEPWTPRYTVSFSDKVIKDGSAVTFTVIVKQDGLTIQVLERIYEDFEYLEHCVITDQPSDGLIIPPLPLRPTTDAAVSESQSKKHMGKGSKTLLADNFYKDRVLLQKYLELLLAHPVLGRSNRLESFLTVKEAPPRTKVRRGLLTKLSESFETRRTTVVPDVEEFFQKERAWLTRTLPLTVAFDEAFQELVNSSHRLLQHVEAVSTALRLCTGSACSTVKAPTINGVNPGKELTHTIAQFVGAFETVKSEGENDLLHSETMSCSGVELWRRYLEAEGAMLHRRTALMLNYQHCNRALDKAKPNRKEAAQKAKKDAEEAFEMCSDVARHEIKRLHRVRAGEMVQLIQSYGRLQLSCATRRHGVLTAALNNMKTGSR